MLLLFDEGFDPLAVFDPLFIAGLVLFVKALFFSECTRSRTPTLTPSLPCRQFPKSRVIKIGSALELVKPSTLRAHLLGSLHEIESNGDGGVQRHPRPRRKVSIAREKALLCLSQEEKKGSCSARLSES